MPRILGLARAAPYDAASIGLLVLAVVVVVLTFDDYGITWDAHYHSAYGKHLLAYWTSLFADRGALTFHNLYLYGGAFDLLVAAANTLSPLGEYETSHLLNALVGLLGVAGCWRLARLVGGPRAAFLAAVLLLLTPSWYGHMFNNPKDIPFAAALVWALYFMARACVELPAVAWSTAAKLGLALGVALGIRIGGVIAMIYLAAAVAWHLFVVHRRTATMRDAITTARTIVIRLLPAGIIAYGVMLLLWPWAQQDPLLNPLRALLLFSHIKWDLDVLFEGRLVNSQDLPIDYLAVYFGVMLPELALVLVLLAPVIFLVGRRSREGERRRLAPVAVLLIMATVFPFAYFALARPVTYDGMRHFLFVLPPMAVVAGLVADRLLTLAARWGRIGAPALASAFLLYVGYHLQVMAELHPNEYVYYNEIVGGVQGAQNQFELDYWGNSYAEAVERLSEILVEEERVAGRFRRYQVAVCSSGISASYFFPPHLELAKDDESADFYISVTRLGCDKELDGVEIARVERDGALLSVVKDRRPLRVKDFAALARRGGVRDRRHPVLKD